MDSPSLHSAQFDFFALQPLLEGLSHLHEWLAISNREGRTLWTSDGQLANDVLAGKMPGPELIEVLPISESRRHQPQLRKRLTQIHQELEQGRGPAGEVIEIGDGTSGETQCVRLTVFCTRISLGQPLLVSVVDPAPQTFANTNQEAVRKLQVLNTELGNDLHSIVHSLRSSLVSLLGFSHLLREDYSEVLGTEGRHFASRIEEAGSALSEKIDAALRLSEIRLDDSDRNLIDPHEILMQIKSQQKLELERARVSLIVAPNMPLLRCRASHLYEIFFHLLMNAAQHMGNGDDRRIEVEISTGEGEHQIEVRDHGQGIPPGDLEKIFEIFRSNPASEPKRAASGVGLAIVRKIAQTYGGRAWVENAADQGARFHVTLPSVD